MTKGRKHFTAANLAEITRRQRAILTPNPPPGVSDAVVEEVSTALLEIVAAEGPLGSGLMIRSEPIQQNATTAAAVVEQPHLPVIFTIAGHREDMFRGAAFDTARALELQGVCQVQPIGYDNLRVPFNNDSGIAETVNQMLVRLAPFPGRRCGVCAASQGGIVWARTYEEHVLPPGGVLNQFLPRFRRAVMFGNPSRQKGVVRPGMPNPPGPNTRGIMDDRIDNTPAFWWEEVHAGDMFAAVEDDEAGEHATAIAEIVMLNFFRGMNSIVAQIFETFINPGLEIWAIVVASYRAIVFAVNPAPHGGFDIRAAIEHMRGVAQ